MRGGHTQGASILQVLLRCVDGDGRMRIGLNFVRRGSLYETCSRSHSNRFTLPSAPATAFHVQDRRKGYLLDLRRCDVRLGVHFKDKTLARPGLASRA